MKTPARTVALSLPFRYSEYHTSFATEVLTNIIDFATTNTQTTTTNPEEDLANQREELVNNYVDAQIQLIYDQGFWDSETLAIAYMGENEQTWTSPPPVKAINPDTGSLDTKSEAYIAWRYKGADVWGVVGDAMNDVYGG